eukprot:GHVU01031010.1.p1 GENE.GHVU01031010.1~~GHVU01031010.1.p1  ORF type:complete len:107 (-),score=13.78 GHVU01031010.1:88-408(-)
MQDTVDNICESDYSWTSRQDGNSGTVVDRMREYIDTHDYGNIEESGTYLMPLFNKKLTKRQIPEADVNEDTARKLREDVRIQINEIMEWINRGPTYRCLKNTMRKK